MIDKTNQSPQLHVQSRSRKQNPCLGMFRSIGRKTIQNPSLLTSPHLANKQNAQNSHNKSNSSDNKGKKTDSKANSVNKNREFRAHQQNVIQVKNHKRKISGVRPTVALEQLKLNLNEKENISSIPGLQENQNKLALNINYLHSNKASYKINSISEKLAKQNIPEKQQDGIISQGISRDGQYYVVSRVMKGEDLKKAVEFQYKTHAKAKKSPSVCKKRLQSPRNISLPQIQSSKTSNKQNGVIKAYAVNTHQGISRKYNEDRVSIILNISKNGVKASYFAIYDGHGGSTCCDFLSQNLHQLILNSKKFPSSPRQALIEGIKLVEKKFIENTKKKYKLKQQLDRSGSCVLICLAVGNQIYIANLGDSRAVLSTSKGKPLYSLSRDHKPTDLNEQNRILKEGGKIYRTQMTKKQKTNKNEDIVVGPLRVFPGKLSVTRTIGDIEAKDKELGGIENCISIDPQICKYTLKGQQDFIVLGCDGIYEKMDSQEVVEEIWKSIKKNKNTDIHKVSGKAAEAVIEQCMKKKSTDNLTLIIICLGDLGINSQIEYRSM